MSDQPKARLEEGSTNYMDHGEMEEPHVHTPEIITYEG
jgi:hypothetical protein